jgi:uncharacterized membrane protein YuzA (DUF378 family)
MNEIVVAGLLFVLLIASSALGLFLQSRLAERHRNRETTEAVRLVMSILVTFTALVLGLLTSSVKTAFDEYGARMKGYAVAIIELDQRLREFGVDGDPARSLMRQYVAGAIADTWPDERKPAGEYPAHLAHSGPDGAESEELGTLLLKADKIIRNFAPSDDFRRQLADILRARITQIAELRWRLIETAAPTISWPLMGLMTSWLVMIFAVFGLSSPRNRVVYATVILCAFSISSAVFMILELDGPLDGWIVVSSEPLRDALRHLDAP